MAKLREALPCLARIRLNQHNEWIEKFEDGDVLMPAIGREQAAGLPPGFLCAVPIADGQREPGRKQFELGDI